MLRCFLIVVLAACSLVFSLAETGLRHDSVRLIEAQAHQYIASMSGDPALLDFAPEPGTLPDDSEEHERAYFDDHSQGDKLIPAQPLQWTLHSKAAWVSTYLVAQKKDPVFSFERPPKGLFA